VKTIGIRRVGFAAWLMAQRNMPLPKPIADSTAADPG